MSDLRKAAEAAPISDAIPMVQEAADALTAQANSLGFLRQISEQQAYEITQQAATIAEQAAEIERLRGIVPELEWLTGCPECGMDAGCDCDSGTENEPEPAALEDIPACMFCGELIEPAAPTVVEPCGWACFKDGVMQPELVGTKADMDFWCASNTQGMVAGPLYATPPRAALTVDQIIEATRHIDSNAPGLFVVIARAIEAAHGIGGPRNE